MDTERIRTYCLSLPCVAEDLKWGSDLAFLIGGKMFAVVGLEPGPVVMSFKCNSGDFADLTERTGIIPAPYLARYEWAALERFDSLSDEDLKKYVRRSYDLIFGKLPRSKQRKLLENG